jgi:four helix bundle protein
MMAKGDDLQERMIDFAVQIIRLCDQLPRSYVGRHLANQLLRSGSSPAAHYAEARGAESRKDFVHKLKICLKELNESSVWLEIIIRSQMFPAHKLADLKQEATELCRIINASIITVNQKASR